MALIVKVRESGPLSFSIRQNSWGGPQERPSDERAAAESLLDHWGMWSERSSAVAGRDVKGGHFMKRGFGLVLPHATGRMI